MHRIQRKPSNETLASVGMDSTIDSRMSSAEVPQMELLKVNYVHQCKEAFMTKTGSIPNYNFMEFKKNHNTPPPPPVAHRKNVARVTVNRHEAPNKPLPPPPPPEIESWQFLQNSKRTTNSPPKFIKQPSPVDDLTECNSTCCHSASESDATLSADGVKSNSWNYRNKMSTCDIRKDMARAGIKSRADRIARIERTECEHSKQTREPARESTKETVRETTRESAREVTREPVREPLRDSPKISKGPLRDSAKESAREFAKDITREPFRDSVKISREPLRDSVKETTREFARNITKEPFRDTVRDLKREATREPSREPLRDLSKITREPSRDSRDCSKEPTKSLREPYRDSTKLSKDLAKERPNRNSDSNVNPREAVAKINQMFEAHRHLKNLPPQPKRPAPVPHKVPNRRLKPLEENQDHVKLRNSVSVSTDCTDCTECSECSQECSQASSSCSDSSCSIQNQDQVQYRKNDSRTISRIPKPIQDTRSSRSIVQTNFQKFEQNQAREHFKRNDKFQTSKSVEHLSDMDSTKSLKERNSLAIDPQILRNTRVSVGNYPKSKIERVHIRKKRQPLLIINQLNESSQKLEDREEEENCNKERNSTCGYKNCNFSNCPMSLTEHNHKPYENDCNKLKRLSLESNSDSGVSSSHDFKDDKKRLTNLKNLDKCSDVKLPTKALKKSEHFNDYAYDKSKLAKDDKEMELKLPLNGSKGSQIKIEVGKLQTNFNSPYNTADPNDVSNFAKKNLIKATTNEALNNSSSLAKSTTSTSTTKQCNIENEQRLKFQNNLQIPKSSSTTHIKIDDDWVKEEGMEPQEDYIECDSLMIIEKPLRKPINSNDNSVKIFVRSSQLSNDISRSSCVSANSFVSQTSICTQNSTNSSASLTSSSGSSVSSSGCGSSNADNHSICESEKECCCHISNSTGMFFNRPCSAMSEDPQQRLCAGSPLSSTDAISDISCVTCSTNPSTIISPPTLSNPPQCCNTSNGVFWNNSYMSLDAQDDTNLPPCCCNISSCEEDNCSYYEPETTVTKESSNKKVVREESIVSDKIEITHSYPARVTKHHIPPQLQIRNQNYQPLQKQQQIKRNVRNSSAEEILIRNQLLRKTDVIHELRPRSMDGIIDSGVSLNGDSSCGPDSVDHLQNQQDSEARRLKRGHVLSELLETERIYVNEMSSILKGYCDQMHSEEMIHLVPASLQGKEDILFGNLHELYTFHNDIFLKDLENCISTTELVALCFVQRRDTFYRLYSFYCQNIPRSDRLRETLVDTHLFLQECQKRLGHKLPLAAYLLKPVQRITKYQLLLKDLLRFSDSGSCTKELQKALDCMLIVLKCVNDSMHQVAITGFPTDLSQQGELLLQDSFQVWSESKKDIRLRIKPQQRHLFLYQKSMLFCKQTSKPGHNKSTYQFKNYLKMSQIGLTESVRGDTKRFEVWLQGRQEVHTLQAPTIEIKTKWVAEIKRVLLNQLEELKGEKIKQYGLNHRGLRQTTSWDTPNIITSQRTISCDASSESSNRNSNCSSSDDNCTTLGLPISSNVSMTSATTTEKEPHNNEACGWSSDYSNSEDEMSMIEDNSTPGSKFVALADYVAVGHSEVSMREGDNIELLKVGCAGWWYVRILDTNSEGWTPAAYLESINRKSSRSSSRNQERLNLNKLND